MPPKPERDRVLASILVKAFRGELVPQHPNDESASVLLERIGQERTVRSAQDRLAIEDWRRK